MTFPTTLVFDVDFFRQAYPEFGNDTVFLTPTLQLYWDQSSTYISTHNVGSLNNVSRQRALNLMTAHIAKIQIFNLSGEVPGIITQSQVDKVQVQLEPPPLPNQFQWWLGTTVYGQQLLAMLQIRSVGGFYTPAGQSVLSAFRY
jgi:hypothetical protein